ncbi:alpha/beta fold hydrolase [Nonomuraea sp. JJY05]|uniref:alpha/beta fold hydrolase n=1 Tax=Nonomuraea sp. JJY05 TaxID=3350255 RepID=UPI00373EB211
MEVPGARLYYETHGSGPLLLLIPGAPGVADVYRAVTQHLTAHFTVAVYDRRGFSRSLLEGSQDYGRRLETDADDAHRLIEHLGAEPAIVFGASSGAVVGLELLARHPSAIRTLIPYEPPAMRHSSGHSESETGVPVCRSSVRSYLPELRWPRCSRWP